MIFRSFLSQLILASFSLLLLSSCQDRKPAIDTFGELDSLKVASDTTMQVNMDRSYEYQKSLAESDSVVYDFLAYDKPKGSSSPDWESKFIVIRRTAHEHDTIIKDPRYGKVLSVMLTDMDQNGRSEIIFYTRSEQEMKKVQDYAFYAYETDGRAKAKKIAGEIKRDIAKYGQEDSFFVAKDFLIRKVAFPMQGSDTTRNELWQSYRLQNGTLIFEKEMKVRQ